MNNSEPTGKKNENAETEQAHAEWLRFQDTNWLASRVLLLERDNADLVRRLTESEVHRMEERAQAAVFVLQSLGYSWGTDGPIEGFRLKGARISPHEPKTEGAASLYPNHGSWPGTRKDCAGWFDDNQEGS